MFSILIVFLGLLYCQSDLGTFSIHQLFWSYKKKKRATLIELTFTKKNNYWISIRSWVGLSMHVNDFASVSLSTQLVLRPGKQIGKIGFGFDLTGFGLDQVRVNSSGITFLKPSFFQEIQWNIIIIIKMNVILALNMKGIIVSPSHFSSLSLS